MLKNIKIYSVVALATLVILGCGSDSDKKSDVTNFVQKSDTKVTMDKLRSLGGDNNISQFTDSGVSRSASKFNDDDQNMGFNEECISIKEEGKTSIFSANNCNDGDATINGEAKISGDENDITFEILQDFSVADNLFSFSAAKGSKISMTTTDGTMTFTANFKAIIDNEIFSANNLSIAIAIDETANGGSFHIKGGEVQAGDFYFKIDPSTTAIVADSNGLKSGTIKLEDGSERKMEIAVATPETISFKIDEDDDGKFSENEITTENIEDFFNELSSEIDTY